MTSLGMPAPPRPTDPSWKQAWDTALYGPSGYLRANPLEVSFGAGSIPALVVALALSPSTEVVLLGSAGTLAPELSANGLRVRFDVPEDFGGLVVAVDWLAHVPTHVVQVDAAGYPRLVHVSPLTGRETLGARLNETSVPQSIGLWLEEWWPVVDLGVGARAEVGTSRDAAWQGVVRRLGPAGLAVAVEPGHLQGDRPRAGSLRSPGAALVPDGNRDLLAEVALDAVAAATGGHVASWTNLTYVASEAVREPFNGA